MNFQFDITYTCDQACIWCNRLCGSKYAYPTATHLTINQVQRYIEIIQPYISDTSKIYIAGGEPTLHPQFFEIVDVIVTRLRYKLCFPISIYSHGESSNVQMQLTELRKRYSKDNYYDIAIRNKSALKRISVARYAEGKHRPIFRAAKDYIEVADDYFKACKIQKDCGYTLTPFGIFICPTAAAYSHLLQKERYKASSQLDESLAYQGELCKYCTYPLDQAKLQETDTLECISPTWQKVLAAFDPSIDLPLF